MARKLLVPLRPGRSCEVRFGDIEMKCEKPFLKIVVRGKHSFVDNRFLISTEMTFYFQIILT